MASRCQSCVHCAVLHTHMPIWINPLVRFSSFVIEFPRILFLPPKSRDSAERLWLGSSSFLMVYDAITIWKYFFFLFSQVFFSCYLFGDDVMKIFLLYLLTAVGPIEEELHRLKLTIVYCCFFFIPFGLPYLSFYLYTYLYCLWEKKLFSVFRNLQHHFFSILFYFFVFNLWLRKCWWFFLSCRGESIEWGAHSFPTE